jgi:hypothetical protein
MCFIIPICLTYFTEMRIMHEKVPEKVKQAENDLDIWRADPTDSNISDFLLSLFE